MALCSTRRDTPVQGAWYLREHRASIGIKNLSRRGGEAAGKWLVNTMNKLLFPEAFGACDWLPHLPIQRSLGPSQGCLELLMDRGRLQMAKGVDEWTNQKWAKNL